MKISILNPDLSHNGLGRAYLLAKILQRRYEVEIVGTIVKNGIWKPVADDDSIEYKSVKVATGRFQGYRQFAGLVKRTDGDVIYVSKLLFLSYDAGLLKKWLSGRPLVLDIDDWELGFLIDRYERNRLAYRAGKVRFFLGSLKCFLVEPESSYWWVAFNEKLVKFADKITVSNSFLRDRFGGTIVWHARDTAHFDPNKYDRNSLRKEYGIEESKKAVTFCGTPRPHKGIMDLITALRQVPEVLLILVGINEGKYCQELVSVAKRELGSERLRSFYSQPFSRIPQFLAMSDIVVIPQTKGCKTIGQVPAKVFDAMAMAKPVVATNVSDLPKILDDCGWLVEPGRPEELANAIRYILDNPENAKERGQRARQRCKDRYSYDAMEEVLVSIFRRYE